MKGKKHLRDVALDHPETFVKYHKGLEKLERLIFEDHTRDSGNWEEHEQAVWIYGETGSGKSTNLLKHYGSKIYFKDPLTKWWDGYHPGYFEAICLDDYPEFEARSGITYNDLLRICQPVPYRSEVKGDHVQLGGERIYITSNFDPEVIFARNHNFGAFRRRVRSYAAKKVIGPCQDEQGDLFEAARQGYLQELDDEYVRFQREVIKDPLFL